MKYIIENWETEEVIKIFGTEGERKKWISENTVSFYDGVFIKDTDVRISCYECK